MFENQPIKFARIYPSWILHSIALMQCKSINWVAFVVLVIATILKSAMVVIPVQGKINLSGPSLQFTLFDQNNRPVYTYADSPKLSRNITAAASPANTLAGNHEPICLMTSASPVTVASIRVARAEAGSVINFYTAADQVNPTFSLSFPIAIYEPIIVPSVVKTGSYGNVQVIVRPKALPVTVAALAVTKAQLTVTDLPYIIL